MKVTVLMAVYNGAQFLKETIDSVLGQSYGNFQFLIINDGSTDNSKEIIECYKDSRIRYVENKSNRGLIYTLNRGLDLSEGEYIARIDADDIALPHRLERQVSFMDANPKIGISGSFLETFGEEVKPEVWKIATTHDEIVATMLFQNSLLHPTVIMRKDIVRKHNLYYNPEHYGLEDYGLWVALTQRSYCANIPEVLLRYRIVPSGITQSANKNREARKNQHKKIYREVLQNSGISNITESMLDNHFTLGFYEATLSSLKEFYSVEEYAIELTRKVDNPLYEKVIIENFYKLVQRSTTLGIPLFLAYQKSRLYKKISLWEKATLFRFALLKQKGY